MDIAVDFLIAASPLWLRPRNTTTEPPRLSKSFYCTTDDEVFSPHTTNRRFRQRPQTRALSLESPASLLQVPRRCLSAEARASTKDQPKDQPHTGIPTYSLVRALSSHFLRTQELSDPIALSRTDDLRPFSRTHSLKPAGSTAKARVQTSPAPRLTGRSASSPPPRPPRRELRQRALLTPSPGTLPDLLGPHPSPLSSRPSPLAPRPSHFPLTPHHLTQGDTWATTTTPPARALLRIGTSTSRDMPVTR
ncbi:hypothetical protein T484DRAFT_1750448 [Baffinella frigidus]|nr:hypothetical protein T484DRAFT_1750448 [Cryptophyta sp. CCMP2293]